MAAPDLAAALGPDEMTSPGPSMGTSPAPGDLFGDTEEPEPAADDDELDPEFAVEAQSLWPDWDDADFLRLQRLIDARINGGSYAAEEGEE